MVRALFIGLFSLSTLGAAWGGTHGWGLPTLGRETVSIRQGSLAKKRSGGGFFGGSRSRRHTGGYRSGSSSSSGWGGGK